MTSVPRSLNGARRCDSTNRGAAERALEREDRRVEPLEVADLQDAAALRAATSIRLRASLERLGDRLFDQHVHAALQAFAGDRVMRRRRRRDADRIDLAEDLAKVRHRAAPTSAATRSRVPASASTTATSCDSRQHRIFLRMEAPQVTDADDGRADCLHGSRFHTMNEFRRRS